MPTNIRMPSVSAIIARSLCADPRRKYEDGVIGLGNKLPWRLKSDLKRFRELTSGHAVVMGRATFESIGKPLPNRTNIVLSRSPPQMDTPAPSFEEATQLVSAASAGEALRAADLATIIRGQDEIFIIGGKAIFDLFEPLIGRYYITDVFADIEGDTYFSESFDPKIWNSATEARLPSGDGDDYATRFTVYERPMQRDAPQPIEKYFSSNDGESKPWLAATARIHEDKIKNYSATHTG